MLEKVIPILYTRYNLSEIWLKLWSCGSPDSQSSALCLINWSEKLICDFDIAFFNWTQQNWIYCITTYSTHRWILFFSCGGYFNFLHYIYHNLLDAGNFHFFSDDYRHFYSMSIRCEKTLAFLLLTISVYILITLQILLAWHALFSASLCGYHRA